MPDLGEPSSYLSLSKGAECFSCDGQKVGKVEHVLAVPEDDIFDGVLLKIDRAAAEKLPEPTPNPGALEVGPDELSEPEESELRKKLGRAWDLISGKS